MGILSEAPVLSFFMFIQPIAVLSLNFVTLDRFRICFKHETYGMSLIMKHSAPFYGHLVYIYILYFTFCIPYLSCINYCVSQMSVWLDVLTVFIFYTMILFKVFL